MSIRKQIAKAMEQLYCGDCLSPDVYEKDQTTSAIIEIIRKAVPKKKEEPKSETWLDWDAKDFIHNGWNTAIDAVLKEIIMHNDDDEFEANV